VKPAAALGPTDLLLEMIAGNRGGRALGLTSVCSANRFVLETALLHAARGHGLICIESTSNQVNQSGGYTGMTAAAFRDEVAALAAAAGVPAARLILGGDHLGPYPWRDLPAREAMAQAHELVRSCVAAGYTKIHLDASMRCADDPGAAAAPLPEEIATQRTAELCAAVETAFAQLPAGLPAPLYVIGTEVPTPGGEEAGQAEPSVTPVEDVERTLDLTCEAFRSAGLAAAWERVTAVVVQPGVEFGDATVTAYDRAAASGLTAFVERRPRLVYEAHSTDYQSAEALRQLVEDHFAILKVGPWLTFAFREAVFALEEIEMEVLRGRPGAQPSRLRDVLDEVMRRHPQHWAAYYRGSPEEVRRKRAFSYSDRCRYYWPQAEVQEALAGLLRNLSERPIPAALIDEFLPGSSGVAQEGRLPAEPVALIHHHIQCVLDLYAAACDDERDETGRRGRER
jgi:D-tagatose-1,6-bisphosphate aldolase subunit GatZ/KbaZ